MAKWQKSIVINTDGASRGNPGPASIGVVFCTAKGVEIETLSESIGHQTNNYAEYYAVIRGLEEAAKNKASQIHLRSDSEFLIKQLKGEYAVKSENIIPLYQEAKKLLKKFKIIKLEHVPRDKNKRADQLANYALDNGFDEVETRNFKNQMSLELEPNEFEIRETTENLLKGYWSVLDVVAREENYICHVEAPKFEDSVQFFKKLKATGGSHFVALDGNNVVGWADINRGSKPRFHHVGHLGMGVLDGYRGKGIGENLLKACLKDAKHNGVEIVRLGVFASNPAAIKLYEKLGFKKEGIRKKASKLKSQYEDIIDMFLML